jgi:hypothetical protein
VVERVPFQDVVKRRKGEMMATGAGVVNCKMIEARDRITVLEMMERSDEAAKKFVMVMVNRK